MCPLDITTQFCGYCRGRSFSIKQLKYPLLRWSYIRIRLFNGFSLYSISTVTMSCSRYFSLFKRRNASAPLYPSSASIASRVDDMLVFPLQLDRWLFCQPFCFFDNSKILEMSRSRRARNANEVSFGSGVILIPPLHGFWCVHRVLYYKVYKTW